MFSLRSKSEPARSASAATFLIAVCALFAAIPAVASAAPQPGEEPPLPQIAFEPGGYDFGLHEANRETSQTNFQLRNVGSIPAPIYSIQVVGSSAFWTGNSDCFNHPLEPNETCSIQVNFNPYDAVPFSAQLRAESEAGTSFTAQLSGEGGRPELTAATNPTNFGSVPVGAGGVTKTIDVTNEGNMPGGAFIAIVSGGAVGSFHLLDENCTGIPLSPGATCNLQVSFDPISTGAKSARLFLAGDGEGGVQIALTGVGLESTTSQSGGASAPQAGAAASQPQPKPRRKRRNRGQRRYVAPSVAVSSRRATR
jgi:HYDIN/CFA65/VesB family protein